MAGINHEFLSNTWNLYSPSLLFIAGKTAGAWSWPFTAI